MGGRFRQSGKEQFEKFLKKMKKSTCKFCKTVILYVSTKKAWFVGQVVKTPPSHGGNTGSTPVRTVEVENFCFL